MPVTSADLGAMLSASTMNTALIIVDCQYDFLPGGALAVPDGNKIIDPILELVGESKDYFSHIFASRDWHPPNHMSFTDNGGTWPPHCVAGTPGADIQDHILKLNPILITKGRNPQFEAYSAFDGFVHQEYSPLLHDFLRQNDVRHVKVCGLALDYCVKATALSAQSHGFHTEVYLDLTRPVDWITGVEAIAALQDNHVDLSSVM